MRFFSAFPMLGLTILGPVSIGSLHAAPTPDPMTWNSPPAAVPGPAGETKITMTATTATDPNGVEYYFDETSENPGGTDSGWQASPIYTDDGLTPGTTYSYNVKARDLIDLLETTVSTPDASATTTADDGTQPLIYEPFNYPVGGLNGASGSSEIGLDGVWTANASALVASGSLSHGSLPTAGNSIGGLSGGSNNFGGARTVSASALTGNGLLDDGAVLWFSVIMGYDSGGNRTNSRLALVLADESMNGGNFNFWFDTPGATGLGVTLGNFSGAGKFAATEIRDSTFGDGTAGNVVGTVSSAVLPSANTNVDTALVVGKITWGATPADPDLIELFLPGTDLAFPDTSTPVSTLSVTVDQSGYDTITWARGDKMVMDEVRFGASYHDVIQSDLVTTPDNASPTPDPASFAVVPTAIDDANVTMTATVANDPSEVEYYFAETTGNPGGDDSGWQTSPSYVDTGLSPSTLYTYTVQTRDKSVANNTGTVSAPENVTTPAVDTTPPTPDPMTFATAPTAISNTGITMTADIATDNTYGVEYFFDETSGNPGGTDSGWQASPTYTDDGLDPNTSYTYTVTARDTGPGLNEGTASGPESTSTLPTDNNAPAPDPATWATPPTAVSDTEVTMTATTATDDQYGVEYYFANRSIINGSHDSGWQDSPTYNDTGLTAFTSYTYQVRVRDKSYANNETAGSDSLPVVTHVPAGVVAPTLLGGPHYILGSDNTGGANFKVSVTPGAGRYSGTTGALGPVYSSFGDGTVLDHRFFHERPALDNVIEAYSVGSPGLISDVATADTDIQNSSWASVWAAADPGFDFSANPADFTLDTGFINVTPTVTGSINISGMSQGIIYFIYGAYRNTPDIDLVMSGPGQTDVTLDNIGNNDGANNNENYIVAVSFLNAGDYNTIGYTFNSSNGRFMGVVLDGESTGGPASPYTAWASTNAPTTGEDPSADEDGDGVSNGVEFVLGGTIAANDLDKLPTVSEDGTNMSFSFVRDQDSIHASTSVSIEMSTDLATWDTLPSPYAVPDTATAGPPVAGVDKEDGTDTVTLTVAKTPDAKKFARLKVVITP
jgi:hypothetical protein